MLDVIRLFALALIAMLLFSGCVGNEAKKAPSTFTIASTTTKITTTTAIPSTTTTTKKVTTTTTSTTSTTSTTTSTIVDPYTPNPQTALISNLSNTGFVTGYANNSLSIGQLKYNSDNSVVVNNVFIENIFNTLITTTSTIFSTTSTLADSYRPNPQAVLLTNLSNIGFAASYDNYSFSIGHLIFGSDNSIIGALLHVARPDGTYVDVSVVTDSADSILDKKLMIRFAPSYGKDVSGVQTCGIYVWESGNASVAVPNESATTSTGWIKVQSALNITYMEDGAFEAVFINNAGADVKIDGVILNETDTELKCTNMLVDGRQASMAYPVTVKYGERFDISADCPSKDYDTGYYLEISISYKAVMDNEVIKHKETGRMTGRVKPYDEHYTP